MRPAGGWPAAGYLRGSRGWPRCHALIADHLEEGVEPEQVVVGIETDRGHGWAR